MDKRPTHVLSIPRNLTEREIVNLAKRQQECVREKEQLENLMKTEVQKMKTKIADKANEVKTLGNRITSATDYVEHLCYVIKDREQMKTIYIAVETGLIIKTEDFTPAQAHRQITILEGHFIEESKDNLEETAFDLFDQFIKKDIEAMTAKIENFDYMEFLSSLADSEEHKYKYVALTIDKMIQDDVFDTDGEVFEFDTYYDIIEAFWKSYNPFEERNNEVPPPVAQASNEEVITDHQAPKDLGDIPANNVEESLSEEFPTNLPETPSETPTSKKKGKKDTEQ
jgi:hypothetical protein